jgi:hypothetical protein
MRVEKRFLTDAEISDVKKKMYKSSDPSISKIIIALRILFGFLFVIGALNPNSSGFLLCVLIPLIIIYWLLKLRKDEEKNRLEWGCREKDFFVFELDVQKALMTQDEKSIPCWVGKTGSGDYLMLFGQSVCEWSKELKKANLKVFQDDGHKLYFLKSWGPNIPLAFSTNSSFFQVCSRLSIRNGFTEVLAINGKRKALFKKFF